MYNEYNFLIKSTEIYREIFLELLYNSRDKYYDIYLDGFNDGKCSIETVKQGIQYYDNLIKEIQNNKII